MRYLGLELGSKTLGIAISDQSNTIASVYKTIRYDNENYDLLIREIAKIVEENDITNIVLGYPLNMNNTIGQRAEITLSFKKMIDNNSAIKKFIKMAKVI